MARRQNLAPSVLLRNLYPDNLIKKDHRPSCIYVLAALFEAKSIQPPEVSDISARQGMENYVN